MRRYNAPSSTFTLLQPFAGSSFVVFTYHAYCIYTEGKGEVAKNEGKYNWWSLFSGTTFYGIAFKARSSFHCCVNRWTCNKFQFKFHIHLVASTEQTKNTSEVVSYKLFCSNLNTYCILYDVFHTWENAPWYGRGMEMRSIGWGKNCLHRFETLFNDRSQRLIVLVSPFQLHLRAGDKRGSGYFCWERNSNWIPGLWKTNNIWVNWRSGVEKKNYQ